MTEESATGEWPKSRGVRDLGESDVSQRKGCHLSELQPVRAPVVQSNRPASCRRKRGSYSGAISAVIDSTLEASIMKSPGLEHRETWATRRPIERSSDPQIPLTRPKEIEWLSIFGLPNDYLITERSAMDL